MCPGSAMILFISFMKTFILFVALSFINSPVFSQNILETLALKDDLIGQHVEGEMMSTDTIVDLINGYYEEFTTHGAEDKVVTRQAAIFHNYDSSKTLAITTANYDFVCYYYESNFYEILKKDSIRVLVNEEILPSFSIKEFIVDSTVFTALNKYLTEIKKNYLDSDATMDEVLNEVYDIVFFLPEKGGGLIATLSVCDYIPTNVVSIAADDWSIMENNFVSVKLKYNGMEKKFERISDKN